MTKPTGRADSKPEVAATREPAPVPIWEPATDAERAYLAKVVAGLPSEPPEAWLAIGPPSYQAWAREQEEQHQREEAAAAHRAGQSEP